MEEIDLEAVTLAGPDGPAPAPTAVAATVVLVDGHLRSADAPAGVEIVPLADAKGGEEALGGVLGDAPDAFAELNTAFAPDPLLIRVAPGTVVDRPIVVQVHAATPGAATFPRLVVEIGADAEATVAEVQTSVPGAGLVATVTEIAVGDAARARYITVQDLDPSTWQVATQVSRVGQAADFLVPRAPPSAGPTPACAPTAAWSAGAPPARCWPPTSATATRCSTSGRSRTTPPPTPPASCCSRGPWPTTPAPSTPASSGCAPTPGAPWPSRPTGTSSSPSTPGPSPYPTWRSRTTT